MTKQMGSWLRNGACLLLATVFAVASVSALAKDEKTRYPNATRHEPKSDLSNAGEQKSLQAAIDAVNGGDEAKAQESAQKVIDSSKSKYAKGIAYQVLANVKFNAQDYKGAIDNYQKLIELNSVPNDAYFDAMYNIAAAYVADGDYQKALGYYKAAYDIDSTYLPTLLGRADLLFKMADWDAAGKIYQTILVQHRDGQDEDADPGVGIRADPGRTSARGRSSAARIEDRQTWQ